MFRVTGPKPEPEPKPSNRKRSGVGSPAPVFPSVGNTIARARSCDLDWSAEGAVFMLHETCSQSGTRGRLTRSNYVLRAGFSVIR